MPVKLANRVKMTVSGTPGTGSITLGSAITGYVSFADGGVVDADTVSYAIEDVGGAWEIGVGTYTASGTVLARTSVTASSAGGTTKISATSAALVFVTALAADLQSAAQLSIAAGKSVTINNSVTFSGTDSTTITLPATSDTLLGLADVQTLTNKRFTPRVTTVSNSAQNPSFAANSDTSDMAVFTDTYTAGISTVTIQSPTGTPTNGQRLILRLHSTNTNAVTLSFTGSNIVGSTDISLPASMTANSKYDYLGLMWNAASSKWDMVSRILGF